MYLVGQRATRMPLMRHSSGMERVRTIRQGVLYDAIEGLSARVNTPVKSLLEAFDLAQTTYNKKKREHETMSRRETEMLLYLHELIDYGLEVFNGEENKFQRWLRKPVLALGGVAPESLFDSITGIREVYNCLLRIDHGNLA